MQSLESSRARGWNERERGLFGKEIERNVEYQLGHIYVNLSTQIIFNFNLFLFLFYILI